jgi:hypothetical protein
MKKKTSVSKRPKKSKAGTAMVDFLNSTLLSRILIYSLLAVLVVFVLYVRVRLLTFPLERDEGEYALMGQMILKGNTAL